MIEVKVLRGKDEEVVCSEERVYCLIDKVKFEMVIIDVRVRRCDCKIVIIKVKFKVVKRKCLVGRYYIVFNYFIKVMSYVENFSKDGWEDVSEGR